VGEPSIVTNPVGGPGSGLVGIPIDPIEKRGLPHILFR
jgi:hypothetical protein